MYANMQSISNNIIYKKKHSNRQTSNVYVNYVYVLYVIQQFII